MIWAVIILALAALFFAVRYLLLRREIARMTGQIPELKDSAKYGGRLYTEEDAPAAAGMAQAVNELVERYEAEFRRVGEMEQNIRLSISGLSHDIRTPLTSLTGYLQLLSKEGGLTDRQKEHLGVIAGSAEAMRDLTENFYELSRLDMDTSASPHEPASLDRLACEILFNFYDNFTQNGIELVVRTADTPLMALADETALKRVLYNLAQNLLRYAQGTATLSFETDSSCCSLTIENESAVALPDEIDRLFDRFYTADSSRSKRGSGLGLYISRKLIERMGGTLTASASGQTLRMTLTLPQV
jgi:signal transduction histidine kinase